MSKKTTITEGQLLKTLKAVHEQVKDTDFIVIGTGALAALVQTGNEALANYTLTEDIDICLRNGKSTTHPAEAKFDVDSNFTKENGFYVQLLDNWFTAHLPQGWEERAKKYKIGEGVSALVLSPLDVASNKLRACRPKDIRTIVGLIHDGIFSHQNLITHHSGMIAANERGLSDRLKETHKILDIRLGLKEKEFCSRVEEFLVENKANGNFKKNAVGLLGFEQESDSHDFSKIQSKLEDYSTGQLNVKRLISSLHHYMPMDVKKAFDIERERER